MQFTDFHFQSYLNTALEEIGFVSPTPVQEQLIPLILDGCDLVGESQTGSGKTHTFLLPIFHTLDPSSENVQAVITAPSRELATQIYQAALQLAKYAPQEIRLSNYIGGTDKQRQLERLAHTQPHIAIGTPGRIKDLVDARALAIHHTRIFVIDEADMTLDMGFLGTVDHIASQMPKDLQTLVFSATIPQKLQPFLKKYLEHPVIEKIKARSIIADTIDNWLLSTKGQDRNDLIYQISQLFQPYVALIFANTKERVDEIHQYLVAQGLKVAKIHGDIPARERKRTMAQIRRLDYPYIVATDLAARGIDIEGVSHVINDAIPIDLSFFVHRVGRTGRNKLEGTAITLYSPSDDTAISDLEKMGIVFKPKAIKNGEFVDSYDRDRRDKRSQTRQALDTEMIGLVKKKKKKIKPGYKKKIQRAVAEKHRKTRRMEQRAQNRAKRKAKKQVF